MFRHVQSTNLRLGDVPRQFRRYMRCLRWIARDGFSSFKGRTLVVCAAYVVGLSTGASSLGGVVLYARSVERGTPVEFGGLEFEVSRGIGTFLLFSAGVAILGMLSATSIYFADRQINDLTKEYEKKLKYRILRVVSEPGCWGWQDLLEGPILPSVKRLLSIGCRWTAFAGREMLRGVLPACTLVAAAACLVFADPVLTALLVPLAIAYLVPLYFINRGVATAHRKLAQMHPVARKAIAGGVASMLDASGPVSRKIKWATEGLDAPEAEAAGAVFYERMLAEKRTQFLNALFMVSCLVVLFVFFGIAARLWGRQWSDLLLYLVSLRFAMEGVRQVSQLFTRLSRYLPEIAPVADFISTAEALRHERGRAPGRPAPWPDTLTVRAGRDPLWDSPRQVEVGRGSVLWVLQASDPAHSELEAIAVRLQRRIREDMDFAASSAFHAETPIDPSLSLRENALGNSATAAGAERLREVLERLGVRREIERLPAGLDAMPGDFENMPLSPEASYALSAGESLTRERQIAFLAADPLAGLSPPFVDAILAEQRGGYTVLVGGRPQDLAGPAFESVRDRVSGVIVLDGRQIRACGSLAWMEAHVKEIDSHLQARREQQAEAMESEELKLAAG